MKKIVFLINLFVLAVVNMNAQIITMGEPGFPPSNPIDCTTFGISGNNFQSSGGGSYPANFNDTTVFCPNLSLGTKVTLTFAINAGFTFDVDGSDSIYVYDGPNTSSPLLGVHNSVTDPNGFAYQASWSNPSGCLTIVFISNNSNQGSGWLANVQCGNQFQPFIPHLEAYINGQGTNALNPLDSGFVDICFGDSILFIARPLFPYSFESTGFGYSQNVNSSIDFFWDVTDGVTYPDNDSIWFTPPARAGYLVDLLLTDAFPQIERLRCKVRVSQLPSFAGTMPSEDVICLGESTSLLGGVTISDTVGVTIPQGTFNLGGNFAGLTYLPDGSGAQYQAPIQIGGFPFGSTIQNAQSLNQVCITMEHSFLGDLEIWLQCPSGVIIPLVNSYGAGAIPGGNSGGGTFLGHAIDDVGGGGPGIGWEYCFSSVFNTTGTMMGTYPGNTIPVTAQAPLSAGNSINPNNTYSPETTFANFTGCPVNGTWTIFVQDNLGIDDGYIFEWGLYFDASYFPGIGNYQNTVQSSFWSPDPTIISSQNDTLITVQPTTTGIHGYTFNIIDNFGCPYDTTINITVQALPDIFSDTTVCNFSFQVAGTTAISGGVWSTTAPNLTISPNVTTNNPLISSSSSGTYPVTFTDNACNYAIQSTITFSPQPVIFADTSLCGLTMQVAGTISNSGGVWTSSNPNLTFSPNVSTSNPLISSIISGTYPVTFTDNSCNYATQSTITFIALPTIDIDPIACDYVYQVAGTTSSIGGVWSSSDPLIYFSDSFANNPQISTEYAGIYPVTFTDNTCDVSLTANIEFLPYIYTQVLDTNICPGSSFELAPLILNTPIDTLHSDWTLQANYIPSTTWFWENGSTDIPRIISGAGSYIFHLQNACYEKIDTATIGIKPCDISAPNIIVLSSTEGNQFFSINTTGIVDFNCVILNRWGNVIYEYNDPEGGWNGKTSNGNLIEEGTYFYRIKATYEGGEDVIKHGFVVLKY
jgi:subtilisin-like proprotein convertase family protein/spore coat protein CotF